MIQCFRSFSSRLFPALLFLVTLIGAALPGYAQGAAAGPYPETDPALAAFRILPYLQEPSSTGVRINWFTTVDKPGMLRVTAVGDGHSATWEFTSTPEAVPEALYSDLEESERPQFPDMFANANFLHSIVVEGLAPGTAYHYTVQQAASVFDATFHTAPAAETADRLRIIAFADSETDPEGRVTFRNWEPAPQHAESTGRPEGLTKYLATETRGFIENLKIIESRKPDLVMLAGDIVQGGGYQRAWDEFFFHTAGKFGKLMTHTPMVLALGNWETFGARNGEYDPLAIFKSRRKSLAHIDGPPNNNSKYEDAYYRIDYGPVTLLTLDSTNGLPDDTDSDTNINIDMATYPGDDQPDINKGSDQWNWVMAQLKDARSKRQVIFVQFHHVPYSSGGHILPVSMEGSSGQAGLPMRIYTPAFQEYGVVAVLCGHNETFERSQVGDVIFYDAGVAGDGLGDPEDVRDPRCKNPYQQWIAHADDPERWKGKQLVDGGRHYGHVEIDLVRQGDQWDITFTPVYTFPVNDAEGKVTGFERRVYDDVVHVRVDRDGKRTWQGPQARH
jgi:hypothetical protein